MNKKSTLFKETKTQRHTFSLFKGALYFHCVLYLMKDFLKSFNYRRLNNNEIANKRPNFKLFHGSY